MRPTGPLAGLLSFERAYMITTTSNAADWHAHMAMKAYRRRDWETYRRHIKIADELRFNVLQMKRPV